MLFTPLLNYVSPTKNMYLLHIVDEESKNQFPYESESKRQRESQNARGKDHTSFLPPAVTECLPLKLTRS